MGGRVESKQCGTWHGSDQRFSTAFPPAAVPPMEKTMPKMKTKRAAMKRFKRTGSGQLTRWHANHTHILTKKSRKRKNKLQKSDLVSSADFRRVNRLLQA